MIKDSLNCQDSGCQNRGCRTGSEMASSAPVEMTWSATRLSTYLTCPRQFRYAYVDGIPSIPTSPLVFGRTLHEALCFLHEYQMRSRELPPVADVLEQFDALWQSALEKEQPFFRQGTPSPQQHQTMGHEILRAYLRDEKNAALPLAAELAFEVQAGEYKLAGIIDRVDDGQSGLVITDFKSGARKPKAADLEGDLQFTLYAFALGQMMDQPIERVVHYHLRDGVRLQTMPGESQFAWLRDEVLPYVTQAVARQEFVPRSGYWCNWCDYRELCRAENTFNPKEVG